MESITDFPVPPTDQRVAFGSLFGHYVSWGAGTAEVTDRIMIRDLTTGLTRIAARADKAGGVTDWSRGDGDHLVYTDQDPSDDEAAEFNAAPWRLYHVNLATGARTLLDRSKPGEQAVVPSPQISGTRVVWGHGGQGRPDTGDLLGLDLATGKRATLVRKAVLHTYYGVSGDDVVYAATAGKNTDLWRVSFSRPGKPVRLTTNGRVGRFHVDAGLVSYETGPPGSDPEAMWVQPVRGGTPRRLATKAGDGAQDPHPGRNLVAWFGSGTDIVAAFADDPARKVVLQAEGRSVSARLDWDGDRVLWADEREAAGVSLTTFHLARVIR